MTPISHTPWERLPEESPKAHHAFVVYRDLGPNHRSLDRVGETLDGTRSTVNRRRIGCKKRPANGQLFLWSRLYCWVDRSRAWDEELDRVRREASIAEVEAMARRHVQAAMLSQDRAIRKLLSMTDADVKAMTIQQTVALLKTGADLERLARGLAIATAEQRVELEVPSDHFAAVGQASTDQLALLESLLTEILASNDVTAPSSHRLCG